MTICLTMVKTRSSTAFVGSSPPASAPARKSSLLYSMWRFVDMSWISERLEDLWELVAAGAVAAAVGLDDGAVLLDLVVHLARLAPHAHAQVRDARHEGHGVVDGAGAPAVLDGAADEAQALLAEQRGVGGEVRVDERRLLRALQRLDEGLPAAGEQVEGDLAVDPRRVGELDVVAAERRDPHQQDALAVQPGRRAVAHPAGDVGADLLLVLLVHLEARRQLQQPALRLGGRQGAGLVGEEREVAGEGDERERRGAVLAFQERRQLRHHVEHLRVLIVVEDGDVFDARDGEVVEEIEHGTLLRRG